MRRARHGFSKVVVVFFLMLFFTIVGSAQTEENTKAKGTIIFNFIQPAATVPSQGAPNPDAPQTTSAQPAQTVTDTTGPTWFFIPGKSYKEILTAFQYNPDSFANERSNIINFLNALKKKYPKGTDRRWFGSRGDVLDAVVFYNPSTPTSAAVATTEGKPTCCCCGKQVAQVNPSAQENQKTMAAKFTFKEDKRKTRIAGDLNTLIKLIFKVSAKGGEDITIAQEQHTLKERSALLTVSVSVGEKQTTAVVLTTGPQEHWFLSADLLVNKISEVKLVEKDKVNTIEPKETPKSFFLGVNFLLGDILKEKQVFWKYFFVKGMLKISKTPWDGYGVGLGFRFPQWRILGVDISALSIFGAMVWTKEENADKSVKFTKRQMLMGISYNLDRALDWVK